MDPTYRIEVCARSANLDAGAKGALHDLRIAGLPGLETVRSIRVYTIAGNLDDTAAEHIARDFLADAVADQYAVNAPVLTLPGSHAIEVMRKQGVMDPVVDSVRKGIAELGHTVAWVRCSQKYLLGGTFKEAELRDAAQRVLANAVIEDFQIGHDVQVEAPESRPYRFERKEVILQGLQRDDLARLSTDGQLYLSLPEMLAIQKYFSDQGRNPTDIELETLAQTWSEHCVHKTFRGRIRYTELGKDEELIDNLLKSTIAKVTHELNPDWCWSVFVDNAGVIEFDDDTGIAFKVETHNHPSAIEPYGGAGTGIGGCIRDPMGTGLGGKPVLNTDVFCFGLPDTPQEHVPRGALHPLRVLKGVVGGVRDYGNRMGIPTANGAVHFDRRYIGNPLVFCGNLALIPKSMANKRRPTPGQLGIVVGGGTGRDGIHGATFSSVELDEDSEMLSSGAVQIGNPIEEKKVLDFLLRARDAGLYTCITDCGAGGLSSALGEMGETCGVEVDLDQVPLKYEGLSYTEIWISEAQERMVIAADEDNLDALRKLAEEENVTLAPIARFREDRKLVLRYNGVQVGELDMELLHDGCPRIEREAIWNPVIHQEPMARMKTDYGSDLLALLGSWNICSKEWIIRQYDHEVQANSVIKPLVGAAHDGPGDAAVVAPVPGSTRGLAVSNGMNPRYSDVDPYHMAASAIDEALRNLIAVGADLSRCAILDNFCWGNCDKPDRLAGLVRAARACHDIALAYGVPFISGKDSLNNEFGTGAETICIPGSLLISAVAVMPDVRKAVTMDLKAPGNALYIVGKTHAELGGSHYFMLQGYIGNAVPQVRPKTGKAVFAGMTAATAAGLVRSAHDCSEGGLAVAAAEMAFAGHFGMRIGLKGMQKRTARRIDPMNTPMLLFSESNSRFVVEVAPEHRTAFEQTLDRLDAPYALLGEVIADPVFYVENTQGNPVIDVGLGELKAAWQKPLDLG